MSPRAYIERLVRPTVIEPLRNQWTNVQAEVLGAAPARDPERYWWLAWTWRNLVFACASCNSQANKGNRFPLREGSAQVGLPPVPSSLPLPDACYDTSVEARLFLHPREDEPLEHLDWRPVEPGQPPACWRMEVIGRSEQGGGTIEVLDLRAVSAQVNAHLRGALWPAWGWIRRALDHGALEQAREEWGNLCARLLEDPEQPFRGASWWALRHLHDRQGLDQHGLHVPARPGVRHPGMQAAAELG